jgi:hypothetical protein
MISGSVAKRIRRHVIDGYIITSGGLISMILYFTRTIVSVTVIPEIRTYTYTVVIGSTAVYLVSSYDGIYGNITYGRMTSKYYLIARCRTATAARSKRQRYDTVAKISCGRSISGVKRSRR